MEYSESDDGKSWERILFGYSYLHTNPFKRMQILNHPAASMPVNVKNNWYLTKWWYCTLYRDSHWYREAPFGWFYVMAYVVLRWDAVYGLLYIYHVLEALESWMHKLFDPQIYEEKRRILC